MLTLMLDQPVIFKLTQVASDSVERCASRSSQLPNGHAG
jgi:hypothetical protein